MKLKHTNKQVLPRTKEEENVDSFGLSSVVPVKEGHEGYYLNSQRYHELCTADTRVFGLSCSWWQYIMKRAQPPNTETTTHNECTNESSQRHQQQAFHTVMFSSEVTNINR